MKGDAMRMLTAMLAVLLTAAGAQAQSVWAGPDSVSAKTPVDAILPQDFLVLLDSMNIDAQLAPLPAGRDARAHPLGVTASTDGLYWDAVFYDCADDAPVLSTAGLPGTGPRGDETPPARGCRDFALSAAFDLESPVSVQVINRFNREYRFARATLTDSGAPALQMDVNLEGGVSREALSAQIGTWRMLLVAFSKHVDY